MPSFLTQKILPPLLGLCLSAVGLAQAHAQPVTPPMPKPIQVNMTHVPSLGYAGLYIAIEKGYFAQRGLDVKLHIVRGGDTTYQVAGQSIEFSGGSADSAFFNSLHRGMPLMLIASLAQNDKEASTNPVVVRKDLYEGGLTSIEQLKGRRVGNLAPGGIAEYLLHKALGKAKLGVRDTDLVSPMGFAQMAEALSTKAIEAGLLSEPFATLGEQRGDLVRLSTDHDLGEQILTIKTSRDYAKDKPEVVVNFLAGFLMGARDLEQQGFHTSENLAIIQKHTKLDPEVIRQAVLPSINADGALNTDSIMKQQQYYLSRGYIKADAPLPAEQFIDTTYLEAARRAVAAQ